MASPRFILASASPRREELLRRLGFAFEVVRPNVDEAVHAGEPAGAYVERVARLKAAAVALPNPGALVLGADTAVVVDEEILGKPLTPTQAQGMLEKLSGRSHRVLTGIAIAGVRSASRVVETAVEFRSLSRAEIDWYVRTGEPIDKAGGYAVQEIGGFLVHAIHGSHSNVIGLPLEETLSLLEHADLRLPWSAG